jgi:tRNA-binding protein
MNLFDESPTDQIVPEEFFRVELRVGLIREAWLNPQARKPAYVLRIDLGPLGLRTSSAQLTENYTAEELVGRKVVVVANFPPKRVAGVVSEVLVLAAVCREAGTRLLTTDAAVSLGARVA